MALRRVERHATRDAGGVQTLSDVDLSEAALVVVNAVDQRLHHRRNRKQTPKRRASRDLHTNRYVDTYKQKYKYQCKTVETIVKQGHVATIRDVVQAHDVNSIHDQGLRKLSNGNTARSTSEHRFIMTITSACVDRDTT